MTKYIPAHSGADSLSLLFKLVHLQSTCAFAHPPTVPQNPKANSSFSVLRSFHLPVLFRLSSHHAVAFFPQRYVTFIREQGLVILRLTTDPLPGSSLASHTLNSHFLDTWAIRLSTNITDTWRQPAAEDRPGWQRVSVRVSVCVTLNLTGVLLTSRVKMNCSFTAAFVMAVTQQEAFFFSAATTATQKKRSSESFWA